MSNTHCVNALWVVHVYMEYFKQSQLFNCFFDNISPYRNSTIVFNP